VIAGDAMRRRQEVAVAMQVYGFTFDARVSLDRVEELILLAVYAAEGVHGAVRVRLEAGYLLDRKTRTCAVEAGTSVGETVAQVLTSHLTREFGEDSFRVECVEREASPAADPRRQGAAR